MIELGMNVKGLDAMRRTLKGLPKELEDKVVQDGSVAMAEIVARTARGIVQVKTGRLKQTIRVRKGVVRTGGVKTKGGKVAAGGKGVIYAPFIEFGTSRARDFPYIRPALDRHREAQTQAFAAASGRAMGKIKAKRGG